MYHGSVSPSTEPTQVFLSPFFVYQSRTKITIPAHSNWQGKHRAQKYPSTSSNPTTQLGQPQARASRHPRQHVIRRNSHYSTIQSSKTGLSQSIAPQSHTQNTAPQGSLPTTNHEPRGQQPNMLTHKRETADIVHLGSDVDPSESRHHYFTPGTTYFLH